MRQRQSLSQPATLGTAVKDGGHIEKLFLGPGRLPESLQLTIDGCVFHWELGEAAYYDHSTFWRHRRWRANEDPPTPRHNLYRVLWKRLALMADGERRRIVDELLAWAGVDPLVRSTHRSLSVEELRVLASTELVGIGAHTVTHQHLRHYQPPCSAMR